GVWARSVAEKCGRLSSLPIDRKRSFLWSSGFRCVAVYFAFDASQTSSSCGRVGIVWCGACLPRVYIVASRHYIVVQVRVLLRGYTAADVGDRRGVRNRAPSQQYFHSCCFPRRKCDRTAGHSQTILSETHPDNLFGFLLECLPAAHV
ncbi:unnamed protein product, partial [Ectocarpus fasciculatus]